MHGIWLAALQDVHNALDQMIGQIAPVAVGVVSAVAEGLRNARQGIFGPRCGSLIMRSMVWPW